MKTNKKKLIDIFLPFVEQLSECKEHRGCRGCKFLDIDDDINCILYYNNNDKQFGVKDDKVVLDGGESEYSMNYILKLIKIYSIKEKLK